MSENRFFQHIQSVMTDYKPEAPQAAYAGMRRKLWWSNFTKISATRFNVWYALLIVSSASLWFNYSYNKSTTAAEVVPIETIQYPNPNHTVPSAQQEQQITGNEEEVAIVETEKPSTARTSVPVSTDIEVVSHEPMVTDNGAATTAKDSNVLPKQESSFKDTSASISKGGKKGLKVKTFQVSDK
jgi:hypothetical protein